MVVFLSFFSLLYPFPPFLFHYVSQPFIRFDFLPLYLSCSIFGALSCPRPYFLRRSILFVLAVAPQFLMFLVIPVHLIREILSVSFILFHVFRLCKYFAFVSVHPITNSHIAYSCSSGKKYGQENNEVQNHDLDKLWTGCARQLQPLRRVDEAKLHEMEHSLLDNWGIDPETAREVAVSVFFRVVHAKWVQYGIPFSTMNGVSAGCKAFFP